MFKYYVRRMLQLTIDDREKAVIPFFKDSYDNFDVKVSRIQISDYIISQDNKIIAAIERKSWADLSASIKDGRTANINKMISLREQTGCKLFYLMEGKARYAPTRKFARIAYKNLQSHLDHLTMRDNVFVIHSDSEEDTVARLIEFMTNYLSLKVTKPVAPLELKGLLVVETPIAEVDTVGGHKQNVQNEQSDMDVDVIDQNYLACASDMVLLSTIIPKTDLEITYNMWSAIPNITSKTASIFIESGYQIYDIFLGHIDKSIIFTMKYPNGTIIGKRSEKIVACIDNSNSNNTTIYCRILAEIPGLTKQTAAILLTKINFNNLLDGQMSIEEIADVQKTEKAKIGMCVANRIHKFLIKKIELISANKKFIWIYTIMWSTYIMHTFIVRSIKI